MVKKKQSASINTRQELLLCIQKVLEDNNLAIANTWRNDPIFIDLNKDDSPGFTIFTLNRYWRLYLSNYPIDTYQARFSLTQPGVFSDLNDWFRLFVSEVLPTIIMTERQ